MYTRLVFHLAQRLLAKAAVVLRRPNAFLANVDSIVHVGANAGQERIEYARFALDVFWIEPIPSVFRELQKNIASLPKQRGHQALLSDRDDTEVILHIANNNGASSSIFDISEHRKIWPDIEFTHDVAIQSVTLSTLIQREGISLGKRPALVLDTQGSELLILKGAEDILRNFLYIKTEAADFESYRGCCRLADVSTFLKAHGFRETRRDAFASRPDVGTYYDVLYKRHD